MAKAFEYLSNALISVADSTKAMSIGSWPYVDWSGLFAIGDCPHHMAIAYRRYDSFWNAIGDYNPEESVDLYCHCLLK